VLYDLDDRRRVFVQVRFRAKIKQLESVHGLLPEKWFKPRPESGLECLMFAIFIVSQRTMEMPRSWSWGVLFCSISTTDTASFCRSASERICNKSKGSIVFYLKDVSSQGRNLALTVLYVPSSLDSGSRALLVPKETRSEEPQDLHWSETLCGSKLSEFGTYKTVRTSFWSRLPGKSL